MDAFIPTGRSERTVHLAGLDRDHLVHAVTNHYRVHREGPVILKRGDGVYVWDTDGNRYLEGFGPAMRLVDWAGMADLPSYERDEVGHGQVAGFEKRPLLRHRPTTRAFLAWSK
jgi:hypothetical protein